MRQQGIKITIVILLSLIFSWKAFSITDLPEPYQLSFRDNIFAFYMSDERTYWAVGDKGLIINTKDGGETWVKVKSNTNLPLDNITFIEKSGWIVGEGGLILHTKDGGNSWEKQVIDPTDNFSQVFFLDKQRGVIVGDRGKVLWTEDGGSSWQSSISDWTQILPESLVEKGIFAPNLYDVFFVDEAHGWLVGNAGIVLFSADGGKSWSLLQAGNFPPIYSLYFKNALEGWGVGQGGFIAHTEDGGKTWAALNSPVTTDLYKIRFLGNIGVVTGDLGTVLRTVNGGKNWEKVDVSLRSPLPWLIDVGLISSSPPHEVIFVGQGIIKKVNLNNMSEVE